MTAAAGYVRGVKALVERPPRSIAVDGETIRVRVRESATARTSRVIVGPRRPLEVIVPAGIDDATVDELLASKRRWIEGKLRAAREIAGRVNQITFMQPMLREVEVIAAVRRHSGRWLRSRDPGDTRLGRHRFHLIEAGHFTSALAPESKGKPDIELLTYLFDAGRSQTEKWLARHRGSIGSKATVDLGSHFLEPRPVSDPLHPSLATSNAASRRGV